MSKPLISNAEMEKWCSGIRDETSSDTAFELLVRMRGTYERKLAEQATRIESLERQSAVWDVSVHNLKTRIAELEASKS